MTRARELAKLSNPAVFSVDSSNNVGVNSTTPGVKLEFLVHLLILSPFSKLCRFPTPLTLSPGDPAPPGAAAAPGGLTHERAEESQEFSCRRGGEGEGSAPVTTALPLLTRRG